MYHCTCTARCLALKHIDAEFQVKTRSRGKGRNQLMHWIRKIFRNEERDVASSAREQKRDPSPLPCLALMTWLLLLPPCGEPNPGKCCLVWYRQQSCITPRVILSAAPLHMLDVDLTSLGLLIPCIVSLINTILFKIRSGISKY